MSSYNGLTEALDLNPLIWMQKSVSYIIHTVYSLYSDLCVTRHVQQYNEVTMRLAFMLVEIKTSV